MPRLPPNEASDRKSRFSGTISANTFLILFAAGFFLVVGFRRNIQIVSKAQADSKKIKFYSELNNSTMMAMSPPSKAEVQAMHATTADDTQLQEAKGASSRPLRPPFQIVLFGEPRSGSTFNHQLLYALARIKTPPDQEVQMLKNSAPLNGTGYVAKVHFPERRLGEASNWRERVMNGNISLFISTQDSEDIKFNSSFTSHALHVQELANLRSCSLCEVDAYTEIFDLTDTELRRVKDYIGAFETIRQCCGLQMSKWEQMRLVGCNITEEEKLSPTYPHCEDRNKTEAELILASRPGGIDYVGLDPRFNWAEVGDCKKFDNMTINGAGFNGRKFSTRRTISWRERKQK